MWEASERQEFELAARHRDRIDDVRRALFVREVVSERLEDFDLIAFMGTISSLRSRFSTSGEVVSSAGWGRWWIGSKC